MQFDTNYIAVSYSLRTFIRIESNMYTILITILTSLLLFLCLAFRFLIVSFLSMSAATFSAVAAQDSIGCVHIMHLLVRPFSNHDVRCFVDRVSPYTSGLVCMGQELRWYTRISDA